MLTYSSDNRDVKPIDIYSTYICPKCKRVYEYKDLFEGDPEMIQKWVSLRHRAKREIVDYEHWKCRDDFLLEYLSDRLRVISTLMFPLREWYLIG